LSSEDDTNAFEVGVEPSVVDAVPDLDEDVADLCDVVVAVDELLLKPPFGVAFTELRTTCWVVVLPDVDGAAAAGAASATLIPAVARPIARSGSRAGMAMPSSLYIYVNNEVAQRL
jgi:hypothetical protein